MSLALIGVRQRDRELVTTQPRDDVRRAQAVAQQLRGLGSIESSCEKPG